MFLFRFISLLYFIALTIHIIYTAFSLTGRRTSTSFIKNFLFKLPNLINMLRAYLDWQNSFIFLVIIM